MWFLAELCGLIALIMEYRYHMLTIQSLKWRIARLEATQTHTNEMVNCCSNFLTLFFPILIEKARYNSSSTTSFNL